MEGKRSRAAAMAVLCVLLLLVLLPGQAAGQSQSEYCECFDGCYLSCRNDDHSPRWACLQSCADPCTIFTSQGGDGAARCACETRQRRRQMHLTARSACKTVTGNGAARPGLIDLQAAPF